MNASVVILSLLFLLVGMGLGFAHYRALDLVTRHFVEGRTGAAIGMQIGRLALLGMILVGAAWLGAMPLLACFAGILAGRWFVLRRAGEDA